MPGFVLAHHKLIHFSPKGSLKTDPPIPTGPAMFQKTTRSAMQNEPVQSAHPEAFFSLIESLQSSPRFPVDRAFMSTESLDPALLIHALQMCSDVLKRLPGNLIH